MKSRKSSGGRSARLLLGKVGQHEQGSFLPFPVPFGEKTGHLLSTINTTIQLRKLHTRVGSFCAPTAPPWLLR